ncbi:hypothetical protein [Olivibacter sitiensis]|uniref:hypothetical protein n=1 Tax=Olivibacter sitiensis TaxID=376470 RepID=UPI0004874F3B|nr:hypothetical protein [Olivibacter sitiensis]
MELQLFGKSPLFLGENPIEQAVFRNRQGQLILNSMDFITNDQQPTTKIDGLIFDNKATFVAANLAFDEVALNIQIQNKQVIN